ncbi:MAG: metallophosphoesterase [Solirubrobacteraceae bacterium]
MQLAQFGQYPAPQYVIAHVSDLHLLAGGRLQFGTVNTEAHLVRALALLADVEEPPQAIIVSGDVADRGELEAYARAKELVESAAAKLDASVFWTIGNHDDRSAYSTVLFGQASTEPQDRVHQLGGLRVISLDTTFPGYHHGQLERKQLDWLANVLASPAADGSLLVMHHPPLPTGMDRISHIIELDDQAALAEILRGSDVRAIISGHVHYPLYGTFAGVPVFTASAVCSTMDLAGPDRSYGVRDAHQAIAMIHVFEHGAGGMPEAPVTHTVLPIAPAPLVVGRPFTEFARLEALSHEERRDLLSKHRADNAPDAGGPRRPGWA